MKKIFAYTKNAELTPEILSQLSEEGYIPIPVPHFDSIRVIEPIPDADGAIIFNAAIKALRETTATATRDKFADYILRTLPPKREGGKEDS